MDKITGIDLGTRLCKVFGLDPDTVAELTIFMGIRGPAMIRADIMMTDAESGELMNVMQDYHLVKVEGISDAVGRLDGEASQR